jgi:hypothetical protein
MKYSHASEVASAFATLIHSFENNITKRHDCAGLLRLQKIFALYEYGQRGRFCTHLFWNHKIHNFKGI